jgi:hypothetical protein
MSNISIRRWHAYIGLFIAPSVLFFALTGMTQIFNFHESHGDYVPPAIVEKLSSIHKDQVFAFSHHHEAAPAPTPPEAKDDDDKSELSTLLLKGFFFVVALCLSLSTAFGLWMGLTQTRQKRLAWALVIAGVLLPVGLLVL